jgi:hypothetical protein
VNIVMSAILAINTTQHYTFGGEYCNVRNFGTQHYTTSHI